MFPVGFGVRPPGWFGDADEESAGEVESEDEVENEGEISQEEEIEEEPPAIEEEPPAVGEERTEQLVMPEELEGEHRQQDLGGQGRTSMVDRRTRRRETSSEGSEQWSTSSSSESSPGKKRRRSHKRKHKKRRHSRSEQSRGNRHRSGPPDHPPVEGSGTKAIDAFRGWIMPEFPEKVPFEELRQEWPTWKDMLMGMLRMKERGLGELSEEDKLTLLLTRGGKVIRDIQAYQPAVEGEMPGTELTAEPKFSNLLKRCDFYFKARDPTTEITVLRGMRQMKDEPVRDYLAKARKQIRLCGYRTFEEQERELVMLLKTNCIDADEISKQSMGRTAAELEALAVSLEELRRRGNMGLMSKVEVKKEDEEANDVIHAVSGRFNRPEGSKPQSAREWGGNGNRQASSSYNSSWSRGGRPNQQTPGSNSRYKPRCFSCGSESHMRANCPTRGPSCFLCGSGGHLKASCPRNNQRQGEREEQGRRVRVNQLDYEDEGEEKVKKEQWRY